MPEMSVHLSLIINMKKNSMVSSLQNSKKRSDSGVNIYYFDHLENIIAVRKWKIIKNK